MPEPGKSDAGKALVPVGEEALPIVQGSAKAGPRSMKRHAARAACRDA